MELHLSFAVVDRGLEGLVEVLLVNLNQKYDPSKWYIDETTKKVALSHDIEVYGPQGALSAWIERGPKVDTSLPNLCMRYEE